MERLSAKLQAEISARPTQTILRGEDERLNREFLEVQKAFPSREVILPESFNGREVWRGLLGPVRDQAKCGSCWSFASCGVLGDRFNINSLGLMKVELSPTKLILCDWQGKEFEIKHPEEEQIQVSRINIASIGNSACYGNTLYDAFRYLYLIGTCTEKCIPYNKELGFENKYQEIGNFSSPSQLPICSNVSGPIGDMCANYAIDEKTGTEMGDPERLYRALHFYTIAGIPEDGGGEDFIKNDIYVWGPVASGMIIYPDFYTFDAKNEIYEWNGKGPQVGGHAIEITGWGVENGVSYWQIKNSWGENWGREGYFRMVRGKNMCDIESNVFGCIPDFFYPWGKTVVSRSYAESPEMQKRRYDIETLIRISGGGLDPRTGFTRRTMVTMPWIDFSRPLELEDLPDWSKFIAGIDASPKNRLKYQSMVESRRSDMRYINQNLSIFVPIISILIITTCVILYLIFKKK